MTAVAVPKTKEEFDQQLVNMRQMRSTTERLYRRFIYDFGKDALKPGQGKGKEPKPWCICHNRNPCPIAVELERIEKYGSAK